MFPSYDNWLDQLAHDFFVGCCVEVLSRKPPDNLVANIFAHHALAVFDAGPFGDCERRKQKEPRATVEFPDRRTIVGRALRPLKAGEIVVIGKDVLGGFGNGQRGQA